MEDSIGSLGKGSVIDSGTSIVKPHKVSIGSDCLIGRSAVISGEGIGQLIMGDSVSIGYRVSLDYTVGLTINDHVTISHEAVVYTHDHGYDPSSTPIPVPLTIGEQAWIGRRAMILGRVHSIGEGAITGAAAVVCQDVPPYTVVAGNPARIIRNIGSD